MKRHMRQMRLSDKKQVIARSMPHAANPDYWRCNAGGAHHWRLDNLTDSTGHVHGKCRKCNSERWDFEGFYPDSEFPKPEPIRLLSHAPDDALDALDN